MSNIKWFAAARVALGLSQKEMAHDLGMTHVTLGEMERDPESASASTREQVLDYFHRRGISVSDAGLKVLNEPIRTIDGTGWYSKLLDDVLWSGAKELLVEFADDRVSPPEVVEQLRNLRANGIKFRIMTEVKNTHIAGQLDEYRLLPSEDFHNIVNVTYGNKVAVGRGDKKSCVIFNDADLAQVSKTRFNLLWVTLPKPQTTSAQDHERF